jgi:hypothetical protein
MRRHDGSEYTRRVGVNALTADRRIVSEEQAYAQACKHVRPPRASREGRAHTIIGVRMCKFHEWHKGQPMYPVLDTTKV